jgi:outer membrane protein
MGALEQRWLLPDAARYDVDEHYDKVRRRGDVPLLTPILRAIDGAPLENNRQRAIRDPAAVLSTPTVVLDPVRDLPVP